LFANRFTALVDACTLANSLKRNLLLTLAEAGFFRLRWSSRILDETERAIEKILRGKGRADAAEHAKRARTALETAFEDAMVSDFDKFMSAADGLPDPNDVHVVTAAIKTRAPMIITENLKHFPPDNLATLNMEAKSAAEFIADTIALDEGRAVAAIRLMRERLNKPGITAEQLLLKMEAEGLQEAVDLLKAVHRIDLRIPCARRRAGQARSMARGRDPAANVTLGAAIRRGDLRDRRAASQAAEAEIRHISHRRATTSLRLVAELEV
jgi:hypothetical protein